MARATLRPTPAAVISASGALKMCSAEPNRSSSRRQVRGPAPWTRRSASQYASEVADITPRRGRGVFQDDGKSAKRAGRDGVFVSQVASVGHRDAAGGA